MEILEEKRLSPISHLRDRENNVHCRMYNCDELFGFVNWYLKVCKIEERYELENLELLISFLNGDKPEDWDKKYH